jgi:hypothetical protein
MATIDTRYDLPFGFSVAAVQVVGASTANTFTDTGDLVTDNDHGLVDGQSLIFLTVVTTTGLTPLTTRYYVISATTNTFQVALTPGGSAVVLTTNGSGTYKAQYEYRIRMANAIENTGESNTVQYEGDNIRIKRSILLSNGFRFDADSLPIGAHAAIFGLTEVTASLPDSYTSAYGLLTAAERQGVAAGFWGEGVASSYNAAGGLTEVTARFWYPVGTFLLSKAPGQKTADKPGVVSYEFNSKMDPTVDLLGLPLPVTGSPFIVMKK